MRSTQTCPKCAGKKFALTDEFRQPAGRESSDMTVPFPAIAIEVKPGWVPKLVTSGRFQAWICIGCGYTEFYASGIEGIEQIAKEHPGRLRIVDAGPPKQGPYR